MLATRPLLAALTRTTPRALLSVAALASAPIVLAILAFRLTIGGALAIYFIVWWTVLFAVLPFAARAEAGPGPDARRTGIDPGAPTMPRMREKAVWTTLWSDLVFLAAAASLPLAGF